MTDKRRVDEVFDFICSYAVKHHGITPSMQKISESLGISRQRVRFLMLRLETQGRIAWATRNSYYIPASSWEPPPGS